MCIYIYKLYTRCFLDHIWYSLDHTVNARTYQGFARTYQANTSNIPGSHEQLYRDWPMLRPLWIVHKCPAEKNDEQFSWKRACAGEFESGYQKHSENFSKKKDDMLKAQGVEDNPRTTRNSWNAPGTWNAFTGMWNADTGTWTGELKKNEIVFVLI